MPGADSHLKTRQVARALGVSVSTVKRWVDAGSLRAARTVGRHRLIPISEAIRLATEQGLSHSLLGQLAATGTADLGAIDDLVEDME